MDFKMMRDKMVLNLACTLCNLGIINPQETYRHTKEQIYVPSQNFINNTSYTIDNNDLIINDLKDNYAKKK